jgi:hypothetical protein
MAAATGLLPVYSRFAESCLSIETVSILLASALQARPIPLVENKIKKMN